MTYGFGRERDRQRRRRRLTMVKWLLALIAIVAAGFYAYDTGKDLARQEVVRLESELRGAQEAKVALEAKTAELQTANQDVQRRYAELKKRFDEKVPTGKRRELLELVDQRQQAGVAVERLASVIAAVENQRTCEGEAVTKRFLVRTSLYEGASNSVGFADSAITITAEGQYASDKDRNPVAWFDPASPVTIRFARLGGAEKEVSGLLPLHASIVIDDTDYRFTVVAGDRRGFVNVTGQGCRYP